MTPTITESDVEQAAMAWFAEIGYATINGANIGPDNENKNAIERQHYGEVFLEKRLRNAIAKLNPDLSADMQNTVLEKLRRAETPLLLEENRRLHGYIRDGVPIEIRRPDGDIGGELARLIDFDNPDNNDWLAVNQYTVVENRNNRRADVVVFVNGMPLAVLELKNPAAEKITLERAYNQLQTYKTQIPTLFRTNAMLVITDGIQARIGTLSALYERFMPWRTIDGDNYAPPGAPELETVIKGVFGRVHLLELLKDFIVFADKDGDINKILAGYHQFYAVKKAVVCALAASAQGGSRKAGVIWHTQGSGKSWLMAFYAGKIITHPQMENPTLVVLTDRNDLDKQLLGTFSMCQLLLRQKPQQAESRQDLRKLLTRAAGGVIFTTLQKFSAAPTTKPMLSERRNIIVIADEAHRSQYGLGATMDKQTGEMSYGFAKYMRDALPQASFIGFTGTPIEQGDVNTPAVFGDYIDIYDISRAVQDGATVRLHYESRLARIALDEDEKPKIDAAFADLTGADEDGEQTENLKQKWTTIEAVAGAQKRLSLIAADILTHFMARLSGLDGKAMAVCMSRRICVALYDEIVKICPAWHSDNDNEGEIKIVMSGGADDPAEWQQHIGGGKTRRDLLAKRIKSADDPLKIVLVCDMWLTGFDAPCLHTLYVDKPMRGHGLMQAIARVNRVFRDKPAGLVVDYIGIAQNLKDALGRYSSADRNECGIDQNETVRVLQEKVEIVRAMFRPADKTGLDYRAALKPQTTPQERLKIMAAAMEWVLQMQQKAAAQTDDKDDKKRAHRRYADAVLALSKAFALAAASDFAQNIREEVAFMQAIRIALNKSAPGEGKTNAEHTLAIRQMLNQAIVSTEIVDIMEAAGFNRPDISIFSDDFLAEMRTTKQKNLAIEALKKLLTGDLRAQSKRNVVLIKKFSERLAEAVARYHANAITTVQMLEELIQIAKDYRAAQARGEASELSDEEIAFYDALADNKSARDIMGEPTLQAIAQELVKMIKNNAGEAWIERSAERANIRVMVKKLLKKYKYPPNLQDDAVQKVVQQAEAFSESMWSHL